jgi:hypothetical protein
MGTNAAYGGSGKQDWRDVRDQWVDAATGSGGSGAGDGDGSADGETSPYDPVAQAIATALIGDDPDTRLPTVPTVSLQSLLPARRGSAGGGGGGGGAVGSSARGSGRQHVGSGASGRRITSQSSRGAAAIAAASAYRDRDPATLASFGLTLGELDALSVRQRYNRILEVAIGEAGHPDEQAMRRAALEQVKAVLSVDPDQAPTALEAVRSFIGELTIQIGLIELSDQYLAEKMTPAQAEQAEAGLRSWVSAKIKRLDLDTYGTVSTDQLHQVARQMSLDVLRLLQG